MPNNLETVPADMPIEEIVKIVHRDGGVIVKNFMSMEDADEFQRQLAPHKEAWKDRAEKAYAEYNAAQGEMFLATNTARISGILAKAPVPTSKVILNPVFQGLASGLLDDEYKSYSGSELVVSKTSWQVNIAISFHVSPGAGDQAFHRDQTIHAWEQKPNNLKTSMIACLVAGSKVTKENGATLVVPGSHLWPGDRIAKREEAVSAEMEKGSALFFVGNVLHGAGANTSEPGSEHSVRELFGVSACRDYVRTEESFMHTVPMSVQRTLPEAVLRRLGWNTSSTGAGLTDFINAYDSESGKALLAAA